MLILGILVGINVIGFVLLFLLSNSGEYWDALIYPALFRALQRMRTPIKAQRVITIIFTIIFLPAIIIYFTVLIIWSLITLAIVAVCEWIEQHFTK